jgi:DNA-binding transcriptional regulator GbsR (MarR family)
VVERITMEDWQKEINDLFEDLKDQAIISNGEEEERDLERDIRIKGAFQKVKCVYPEIKTIEDLLKHTSTGLTLHPNVRKILGQKQTILSRNRDEFATEIKLLLLAEPQKVNMARNMRSGLW